MFVEQDVFLIEDEEYKLRAINQHNYCWMEPVLHRSKGHIISGGLNRIVHYDELDKYHYIEWR